MASAEAESKVASAVADGVACDKCAVGYVWGGEAKGTEILLDGIPAYYAAAPSPDTTSAILFIHDAFGWKFPNNRLLCDMLAASTACHVYCPDFYEGETPLTEEQAAILYDKKPELLGRIVQGFQVAVAFPVFLMHILKFGVARVQPAIDKAVGEIQKKHGAEKCKLGALGYCWGGKFSLRLGAEGKVAATVACHPSLVKVKEDNLTATKTPTLFICAEKDDLFTQKVWEETEAALKEGGATYERVVYPGTSHGFTVRCQESDAAALKARDEALSRYAAWFSKYLAQD